MTRWIKNRLTNIFTPQARAAAPSNRFRPSMIALEDRTVPSGSDLFASATVLTGNLDSDTGSNVGATAEPGEQPILPGMTIHSVWWQWTASSSGLVEVNTVGSDFDTALGVYTGTAVNDLTEVAVNDDAVTFASQLTFDAVTGTTYYIAVDGLPNLVLEEPTGTGNIVLNFGQSPSNDNFASATAVAGDTVQGYSLASTGEPSEPSHDGEPGPTNSVWWAWTATESGLVEMNTLGSSFDTVMAVYTGTSVDSLTEIVSNDDGYGSPGPSLVQFNAVSGTTYYIAVDGFLNETGTITLTLPDAPTPTNNPPEIDPQVFSLNENSMGGHDVGIVAANDPDAGQSLTYEIIGGNETGTFSINSTTGLIEVLNGSALDFEANSTFVLTVQVTDNGAPPLSASAAITINLNDVNEAPTAVPAGPFSIAENSAIGIPVGSPVTSTDPDAGDAGAYSIQSGNTSGAFAINPSTGQITVANSAALDFETTPTFTLIVRVTDKGGLFGETSVTINLSDVNEQSPTQLFLDLNNQVVALRTSGDLTNPQANKLLKDLEAAERQYNKGNLPQAENQLQMFINQVNVYVNSGVLTSDEAAPLLQTANDLLSLI